LGVSLMNAPVPVPEHGPERVGFQIGWVTPESPAERAGVKAGDVIAGVDDQSWSGDATTAHLTAAIGGYKPGETVRLTISRDGKIEHLQAVLTRRPASLPVPNAPEAIQLQWGQFELTPQQPLEEIKRAEQSDKDRFFRKWLRENRPGR
jgi:membrane-associated protease RseP (regulator of RpoE activity)